MRDNGELVGLAQVARRTRGNDIVPSGQAALGTGDDVIKSEVVA